jgi:hypothetical protein
MSMTTFEGRPQADFSPSILHSAGSTAGLAEEGEDFISAKATDAAVSEERINNRGSFIVRMRVVRFRIYSTAESFVARSVKL